MVTVFKFVKKRALIFWSSASRPPTLTKVSTLCCSSLLTFKLGNFANRKALFQWAAKGICWLVLTKTSITYHFPSIAAVKLMNKSGGFCWREELPWRTSSQTLPLIGWPKSPGLKWFVVQRCRLSRESWNTSLKTWVLDRRLADVPEKCL